MMELPSPMYDLNPQRGLKRICIIGAGPSGLAVLKIIKDTQQYKSGLWEPVAFEARENIGGIWLPAPPTDDPPLTSMYDSLTTNLPHPIMSYTGFPFPPSTPVFPRASIVQKYLLSYTDHFGLIPHVRFKTSVESVERKSGKWQVKVSTGESSLFDLVMVCNGGYRVPRYPNAQGVENWLKSGKATHSAWYRRPRNLGKVLVVGGGPSGSDISAEMASVSPTIIHSVTGGKNEDIGNIKTRGRASRFEDNGRVVFEDGTVEEDIDHCILATGYETAFPFFSESNIRKGVPPPVPPLPSELYNTTYGVFPLAKHIFPLHDPSLAFLRLPGKVIPFPLVEAQARAILHVFIHPEAFNSTQEAIDVITRYEELRSKTGDDMRGIAKAWDVMPVEQFDYRDELHEFAAGTFEVVKVEEWEKVMLKNTDVLRTVWRELERSREADEWVKGVGENGTHEWVSWLERMLEKAKEMGLPVLDIQQAPL
ncbi:FAD/NAD-P-binding domain containing protein [Amanita muscaria]